MHCCVLQPKFGLLSLVAVGISILIVSLSIILIVRSTSRLCKGDLITSDDTGRHDEIS